VDGGMGSQALLRLYSAQGKTILEKRMKNRRLLLLEGLTVFKKFSEKKKR
jgi:lysozyme family protein